MHGTVPINKNGIQMSEKDQREPVSGQLLEVSFLYLYPSTLFFNHVVFILHRPSLFWTVVIVLAVTFLMGSYRFAAFVVVCACESAAQLHELC